MYKFRNNIKYKIISRYNKYFKLRYKYILAWLKIIIILVWFVDFECSS